MKANQKFHSFMRDNRAVSMMGLVAMAIGVLTLIVVYTIIPLVGSQLDASFTLGASSDWNSSHNSNIPTGVSLWESLGGIIKVAAIILIVAGFLQTLREMRSA